MRCFSVCPPLLSTLGTAPAPALPKGVQLSAAEREAVQFREDFGFSTDVALVRTAQADRVGYSSEPYGVPLSKAERAEMGRRATIQVALDAAVDRANKVETYAGVYLDQRDGGRPVFLFTEPSTAPLAELRAMFPTDANVRIQGATRTERQLLDLKDRMTADLDALWKQGIQVVRIAYKPSINTLRIGVQGVTDGQAATLKSRYLDDMEVFEDAVAQADSCPTTSCRPMKAGIGINPTGLSSSAVCTSGWIARAGSTGRPFVLVTAGHCIERWGGETQAWQHPVGSGFGRALKETWQNGTTTNPGQGPSDVGLITIQSGPLAEMTQKNQIRRKTTDPNSITNVTGVDTPQEGDQACRVGIASGHGTCGTVTEPLVARFSDVDNWPTPPSFRRMRVTHATTWNRDSQGGDSGGPVFYYTNAPSGVLRPGHRDGHARPLRDGEQCE